MRPAASAALPDLGLAGKVVWVTGASRGLGRAIATALGRQGARLAITARDEEPLRELAASLGSDAEVVVAPGSVSAAADVERCVERIVERFGGLDALVNNAGISPTYVGVDRLAEEDWRATLEVNLTGSFLCSKAAGRVMLERAEGAIVNVSSVYAHVGGPRLAAYAASKSGLEALTRSLALEWAQRGVRVNAVAAGYLRTDLTSGLLAHERYRQELLARIPMGRFGEVDDVVPAVLYLASPLARYVTGATLIVDGGWTAQ